MKYNFYVHAQFEKKRGGADEFSVGERLDELYFLINLKNKLRLRHANDYFTPVKILRGFLKSRKDIDRN